VIESTELRECDLIDFTDQVLVKIKAFWRGKICFPKEEDDEREDCEEISAVFRKMTFGDNSMMTRLASYEVESEEGETVDAVDFSEITRLMLRRLLMSWSLDIPLEFTDSGWLTDRSFDRVKQIPAPLANALIREYEKEVTLDSKEEDKIERQSVILFSQNSRGVENACESIGQFCTYGSFWDKFGIDSFSLSKMPYKDFLGLKMMLANENESHRRQMQKSKTPPTKIAGGGFGGKTRASRGVVMGGR